ncbi:hypothetical protein DFH09DRAFT_595906 [Mycena vulgaris]|nr:hypothetical protein DFH09DRAFT_595906 [Mycena vulgaris]
MGLRTVLLECYGRIWGFVATVEAGLAVSNIPTALGIIMDTEHNILGASFVLLLLLSVFSRAMQFIWWLQGKYAFYYDLRRIFSSLLGIANITMVIYCSFWTDLPPLIWPDVYVIFHAVLCIMDTYFGSDLRQHIKGLIALQCLDYLVSADLSYRDNDGTKTGMRARSNIWSQLPFRFRHRRTSRVVSKVDDELELLTLSDSAQQSSSPRQVSQELTENLLHWASDTHANKAL